MAKTAYTGLQGHGKSFEVVRGVVLPNCAKGRRVVTNIAGLQIDLIREYCVAKLGADADKLGEIVQVRNEDITKPDFFPREMEGREWEAFVKDHEKRASAGEEVGDVVSAWWSRFVVKGGDVAIIDECWRWYVTGEVLPAGHLTFFRMHRHFLHPVTGQTCDVVLIVQDIADLQRKVLATIEKSFFMKKHKELGMAERYVVTIYAGKRQTKRTEIEERQEKYDPEIFPLYKSYSQSAGGGAKEEQADKRGNVFNQKIFRIGVPLAVIGLLGGGYNTWKFFHPEAKRPVAAESAKTGGDGQVAGVPKPTGPVVSDVWRLVGSLSLPVGPVFMLVDGSGRVRYVENPPGMKATSSELELALPGGEIVTRWSGQATSVVPGLKK